MGSKREPARVSGRATSAAARIKKARATKQATSVKPARAAQATTAAKPTSAETPSHGLSLAELGRAGDFGALAHYADPAYYQKAYAKRLQDVEFYRAQARDHGASRVSPGVAVLEYGVGTGRVGLPLARDGHQVTGVDLSASMLAELKTRLELEPREIARRLKLVRADMRQWPPPEDRPRKRFDLVICAFNTLLHLYTRQDVEAFFAQVKSALKPDGRFIFDFSLARPADLALDPNRNYAGVRLRDPTSGKLVKYSERFEYDPVRQVQLCWMQFVPVDGSTPWAIPLTHRQFFPQEMEALLHYAGFREISMTADFEARALHPAADWVVVSCKPPRKR